MRFTLTAAFFLCSFCAYSTALPVPTTRFDTLPEGHRYNTDRIASPLRPAWQTAPRQHTIRAQNTGVQPNDQPLKVEILLPPGINEKTITVAVGQTMLKSNEDYQYNPATNRLQILNQEVLRSQLPIEISYDAIRLARRFTF